MNATTPCRVAAGLVVDTPAKINLRLEVLGPRPDGYHEIRSLAATVGLYDRLTLQSTADGDFEVTCNAASAPAGDENLAIRAARRFAEATSKSRGLRIAINKRIPIGGGMGGGSSDAAGVLVGLNKLWCAGLDREALAKIGATIGSDVPLFLWAPACFLSGRGTRVAPATMAWSGWAVLACGGWEISTAAVYNEWHADDAATAAPGALSSDEPGLMGTAGRRMVSAQSVAELWPMVRNDLEPAVLRVCPQMADFVQRVRQAAEVDVRISGAGSTAFALFDDPADAESCRRRLSQTGIDAVVAAVDDNVAINMRGINDGDNRSSRQDGG